MDTLLTQISSGVISCDKNYRITLVNKRTQNLFNINADFVKGKLLEDIFPKEICELIFKYSAKEEDVHVHEIDVQKGRNSVLPLQVSVSGLFDIDANHIGYIITVEKVELLRENQRVKAWKEVATRVAHEIKNPLTPVKLSAERLQRKFGTQITDPAFKDCTTTIISHVDLIRDLVNEFNQFARFPKLKPSEVDLIEFVSELVSIYKSSHPKISFNIDISEMMPLLIDKDQMKRVFINLIENSIEAMKDVDSKSIFIEASYSLSGNVVVIRFYDSGPGVPIENWSDVFQSKYTTK
jgi:two-component system nitrogen regulation sensor histidine kinase NtrY